MPSFAPWYSNRGQGNHLRGLLDNLGLEGWRSRDDFIGTTTVPGLRYRLEKLLSWLNLQGNSSDNTIHACSIISICASSFQDAPATLSKVLTI